MARGRSGGGVVASALVAFALVAGACTGSTGGGQPSAAPSGSSPAPSPNGNRFVSFDMRGGDAFAWSEAVSGTANCPDVSLRDNGAPVKATVATSGSAFHADVPLQPGVNSIVARCSEGGTVQKSTPLVWHERLRAGPTAWIHVSTHGGLVILDGSHSEAAQPDGAKVVGYAWHRDPRHPASLTLSSGAPMKGVVRGPQLELRSPAQDGDYYVSLTVTDARGRKDTSTTYFTVQHGVSHAVDMMTSRPSWIASSVIYAPIAQLWGNGGPRSIENHLPYLKRLGVNVLWLWPPTEQRMLGEEYRITDYFKLDPSWGPPSAFKRLVDAAHKLGMHVLIDFVPNHTSVAYPYYRDQQRYGKASHYYDFYQRNKSGKIVEYSQIFGTTGLPNLNYDNSEVRRMITEACLSWIRKYGIDGFRIDAAWGVQLRRPTFWAEWRRALKRVDPDLMLLAEASALDAHIFKGFDLAYDWTSHPGEWAWTGVFDFPDHSGQLLAPALTNAPKGYPKDSLTMRFLNNNDTSPKFVAQYGSAMTRVAATLQFTVTGIPEVWAGDEIGATYETYSNLTPISWKDRLHLRPLYERLIHLRRTMPTLWSRAMDVLDVNKESAIAYVRPAFGGGPPVLVLLNFGDKQPAFSITKTPELASVVGNGTMHDLLTGKTVKLKVSGKAVMHPLGKESMLVLVPGGG